MNAIHRLKALGIAPADVLLPAEGVDLTRWAAIACDQYTSEPEYWDDAYACVGGSPSALRLIIPEAFLETPRGVAMQQSVVKTMEEYLASGVFREAPQSFVYVERRTPYAALRRGLVAAFDLEKYDYTPGNRMPIRATEGTIVSRLPPRLAVRRRAALECPHVMVLIDDPGESVIEPLSAAKDGLEPLYSTELMAGAGAVSGWRVAGEAQFAGIAGALEKLAERGGMLFAVGDGNHSLATAKAWWDELKASLSPAEREAHPARWALAELVNIRDAGLSFHAIHRVVTGTDPTELVAVLLWHMNKQGWGASLGEAPDHAQTVSYACAMDSGHFHVANPPCPLAAGTLQAALDAVLPGLPGASVDYVHGDEAALTLAQRVDTTAFLLGAMDKAELFPAVERIGVLPRKAFSMGEAGEKRFYLECRRIR